jgi:hypothetical protein
VLGRLLRTRLCGRKDRPSRASDELFLTRTAHIEKAWGYNDSIYISQRNRKPGFGSQALKVGARRTASMVTVLTPATYTV